MLNNSILLYLFVFIAGCVSMPTNNNEHHEPWSKAVRRGTRDTEAKIDGPVHQLKGSTMTYQQRFQDGECLIEYDGRLFAEQQVMRIRNKMYRVEDCLFERVFHACGPTMVYRMLTIVCQVVEQHVSPRAMSFNTKRDTSVFDGHGKQVPRMISESCCENFCSISELTRYCHSQ